MKCAQFYYISNHTQWVRINDHKWLRLKLFKKYNKWVITLCLKVNPSRGNSLMN